MARSPKCPQGAYIILSAFICKDTVRYHFQQQCDTHTTDISFMPVRSVGIPPLPKNYNYRTGDTGLIKAIEKNCSFTTKLGTMDSTLVFWGKVSKLGMLGELELKAGNRSYFSDYVKKQIEDPVNEWAPSDTNDRHFDSYMRIYVKLNKDRTIDLVYGSKLLTINGR